MPHTADRMGLIHKPGIGPNDRFGFKNKSNNRVNESKNKTLTLVKLPYKINELEPVLSKINVDYHYNVLSAGYVNRYNNNEGDPDFNYGGAMLHNLFWAQLRKPKSPNSPTGIIKEFIEKHFKNYNTFKEEILSSAMSIQGSGWVYLAKNGTIKTTPNQSYKTDILMPIDMWEHSFSDYIPAKDAKKKYITNIMKIIDWEVINHRMATLKEDAAGVGIITKQNTTQDVKPGDEYKNVKKLSLENFADGRGPGRPGDSQRHGIPKNATMAQLHKAAKAPGRKGQLARWQINMRRGRKKSR